MKVFSVKSVFISLLITVLVVISNPLNVLAANAIVTSDLSLGFDNIKLEKSLTNISNSSGLNVVFYSINSQSPNTVDFQGIKINKAIYLNDNFISSIKSNNYITLFYNKDSVNANKGSFSVNVGADYRSVIDKDYITKDIVNPNIKKYLPQNPEEFIPVVAQLIIDRINIVNNWNKGLSISFLILCFLFAVILISYLLILSIKYFNNKYKKAKDTYKTVSNDLERLQLVYKELITQDPYLKGYEGQTKDLVDSIRYELDLVILDSKYSSLLNIPSFNNCFFNKDSWAKYVDNIYFRLSKWTTLNENITNFFKKIEGINSADPLTKLERIEQERLKQETFDLLLDRATVLYNNISNYVGASDTFTDLYNYVKFATTIEDRESKFSLLNSAIEEEFKVINEFKKSKDKLEYLANYIINNSNNYPFANITETNKAWAHNILTRTDLTNYKKVLDLYEPIKELENFVKDYKEYDLLIEDFNKKLLVLKEEKTLLINSVNTISNKFISEKRELIKCINEVQIKIGQSDRYINNLMSPLYSIYNDLLKKSNQYTSRKDKAYRQSYSRQTELNQALDRDDYTLFDNLIIQYQLQDSVARYSSSSSNSSNSFSDSSSSYSSSWSDSSSSSDSGFSDSSSSDSSW